MTKKEIFTAQLLNVYKNYAEKNIGEYLVLCELSLPSKDEQSKHIINVYHFSLTLFEVDDGYVEYESIKKVINKFSTSFELHNLQLKLLNLLLSVIEKVTGLKAGPLPASYQLKQEQPILSPDMLLNSNLYRGMYKLLENNAVCKRYIANPSEYCGFLVMWLVLKEGIRNLSDVIALIDNENAVYTIDKHWFFESKEKRFWLSTKAELLLSAYYQKQGHKIRSKALKEVNRFAYKHGLISKLEKIRFSALTEALKNEHTFLCGPIEWGMSAYSLKSTHIKKETLYRLVTGTPVEIKNTNDEHLVTTVRQNRAWFSAYDVDNSLRKCPKSNIEEVTVKEQLALIKKFTIKMKKSGISGRKESTTALRNELRLFLEDSERSKSSPWCWLILGWMYQLLDKGGKVKSSLKLNTIRSYIDYVALPFITEFSGCDPSLLSALDWAEKINIAAEKIRAPTKKAYLIYFSEYLIESGITKGLCLSDIDIPTAGILVNANIITPSEADKIIREFEKQGGMVGEIAQIIFNLGFYAGLRRGEIKGLQFKDFHSNNDLSYFNLHIRPNKYRELKSSDSSRNLPLDVLLPEAMKVQLRDYLHTHKTKFKHYDSLIFDDSALVDKAFDVVTMVMQMVIGDQTVRFHHCRHSFCNWSWIRIHSYDQDTTNSFSFLKHAYFSEASCLALKRRLSLTDYSRKKMWTLSTLLGHASPTTTISSYLHIAEWIRRTRFASHCASESELRAFWGERIKTDEWGRVKCDGRIRQRVHEIMPPALEFVHHEMSISPPVKDSLHDDKKALSDIDISLVWRVIRRLGEGIKIEEVSEGLNVRQSVVEKILAMDKECSTLAYQQSKYSLQPLLNYQKLNLGNIDTLQKLIIRFEKVKETDELKKLDLAQIPTIVSAFVGAKDGLIRTYHPKAALTLIRLFKLLKIPSDNIKIKWYLPFEQNMHSEKLLSYLAHFNFWQESITKHCGYRGLNVEVIAPHILRGQIPPFVDAITWSDDGKYLAYKAPGYISIHVRQTRFQNQRCNAQGEIIITPQRTKALISFIRLLCIKYWIT
ncbi:hypothetical protein [Photobacterium leiognathi]|uniref:hypothetical protein n=1 Tax=Photobacterium leiognathi TaxID=553611 RepID=UPI00273A2085|nr:hypothetical protein [Photobacterium leiognathi]